MEGSGGVGERPLTLTLTLTCKRAKRSQRPMHQALPATGARTPAKKSASTHVSVSVSVL